MKKQKNKETIADALGLSTEWKRRADRRILRLMETKENISDIIEDFAYTTKDEEFGDGDWEITEYEKKLMLGGFMLGQALLHRTMHGSATEALIDLLMNKRESHFNEDED
jgi:hypothetical protein